MILSEQLTRTVGEQFSRAYCLSLDATHEGLRSALRSGAKIAKVQRDACDGLLHKLSDEGLLRGASDPVETLYFSPWNGSELMRRSARWLRVCMEVATGTQAELNAVFRDEVKQMGEMLSASYLTALGRANALGNPPQGSQSDFGNAVVKSK